MILVYEQFVDSVSFIQSVIWRWMQLWMYDVNRKLKQQQRQRNRQFKINIIGSSLHPRTEHVANGLVEAPLK